MGGFRNDLDPLTSLRFNSLRAGRGGGKCPEEEHTTCSGGPTIVIVTSAVYGERYYL
jgi:hypothetical protein